MYLGEAKNEQERHDLAMIIEETLRQRYQGVKNEKGVWVTPSFQKLIYVLEEDNIHEDSPYWYLTELAARCTAKRMVPDYISEKKMLELKVDKNGEGHCYTCMGCRQLPDAVCRRKRKAEVLRPLQSGRRDHQSAGCGAVLRRQHGEVLEDLLTSGSSSATARSCAATSGSRAHALGRRAHPVAVRRAGPPEEGRADRQAPLRRLLDHLPRLRGTV